MLIEPVINDDLDDVSVLQPGDYCRHLRGRNGTHVDADISWKPECIYSRIGGNFG